MYWQHGGEACRGQQLQIDCRLPGGQLTQHALAVQAECRQRAHLHPQVQPCCSCRSFALSYAFHSHHDPTIILIVVQSHLLQSLKTHVWNQALECLTAHLRRESLTPSDDNSHRLSSELSNLHVHAPCHPACLQVASLPCYLISACCWSCMPKPLVLSDTAPA